MASKILHKRKTSATGAPSTSDLDLGEIGINTYDGKLYIKKEAMMLLIDTTIDFSTGINGNYIIFKNPNATSQCGCGESFGI